MEINNDLLYPKERIDDLQYKGLRLIQHPDKFCFGTDAVLLAAFVRISKNDRILDIGTGTGIIPILLAGRTEYSHADAIDIQADMADMACRSVKLNNLCSRITVAHADIRALPSTYKANSYDRIISNPPYKKAGSGIVNPHEPLAISRHEVTCTLEDICSNSARLLRHGGTLTMVHQSERIIDIFEAMRNNGIEPKRLRTVQSVATKAPNLILVEGSKGGKPYLTWEKPLVMYNEDGSWTEELLQIYHRGDANE